MDKIDERGPENQRIVFNWPLKSFLSLMMPSPGAIIAQVMKISVIMVFCRGVVHQLFDFRVKTDLPGSLCINQTCLHLQEAFGVQPNMCFRTGIAKGI